MVSTSGGKKERARFPCALSSSPVNRSHSPGYGIAGNSQTEVFCAPIRLSRRNPTTCCARIAALALLYLFHRKAGTMPEKDLFAHYSVRHHRVFVHPDCYGQDWPASKPPPYTTRNRRVPCIKEQRQKNN